MKDHIKYECRTCGYKSIQWSGQCHKCTEWNSFELYEKQPQISNPCNATLAPLSLQNINYDSKEYIKTSLDGFDYCLGGGIVSGSVILLSGDPGVGKTTLLSTLFKTQKYDEHFLFVSGEETLSQMKKRFVRLNIINKNIFVSNETNWEQIQVQILKLKPKVVILDSIQVIFDREEGHVIGSVLALRSLIHKITTFSKKTNITVVVVCHITKAGDIAGPKNLEHMVDTVLYMEKLDTSLRLLRCLKNRFSTTSNIGSFKMTNLGIETYNVNQNFFESVKNINDVGQLLACSFEQSRFILYNIESMIVQSKTLSTVLVCNGVDKNRVNILIAICESVLEIKLSSFDIYINMFGATNTANRMTDLAIIMSLLCSYTNSNIDNKYVFMGEVNLNGHLIYKDVNFINELSILKNKIIILPRYSMVNNPTLKKQEYSNIKELYENFFG